MSNPNRRRFLAGLGALAAAAPLAKPGTAPPPSSFLGPHIPAEAEHDSCLCRRCIEERMERGAHPLRQRVGVACHKARAAAWVLWYAHAASCKEEACGVCESADFAAWHLDLYRGALECELTIGPDVQRAEEEFGRVVAAARKGRFPKWPPARGTNHPAQEPLALALMDLADALQALLDGHGCGDACCEPCDDAHGMKIGVQHILDTVTSFMIPTEAILRREGNWPRELR